MKRCTATEPGAQPVEPPYRATFIVRMWHEPGQHHPGGWRGTVEHVQAGDRRAVIGAEGLLALLSAWLQEEPDRETARSRLPDA